MKVTLTVELSEAELKDANILTARQFGLAHLGNPDALKAAPCETSYTPQAGEFVFDLTPPPADQGAGKQDAGGDAANAGADAKDAAAKA